jgi:AAA domain-containing protein/bifunctional DNA primase/polymerase-like protein
MIPDNSFVLALKPGEKVPDPAKNPNGTKDAQPVKPGKRPNGNYGIRLDGQYIVVDIDCDNPDRESFEASLELTWSQRTARTDVVGMHYLYRVPEGYIGSGKRVWLGADGNRIADIKAKGYIVGPGSTVNGRQYTMINATDPVEAPAWLLDFCRIQPQEELQGGCSSDGIPNGEHDSSLAKGLFLLATNLGLGEEALKKVLREGLYSVLQDVDPSNPYTEADDIRLAHSAVSKGTYKALELVEEDETWKTALDIDTKHPLEEWYLYNFIPKGELVLQYGAGGIGKSTWMSYLAATLIDKGITFGFSGSEEPFDRFTVRTHLSNRRLAMSSFGNLFDIGNHWRFPRDADKLRAKLETCPLKILYFDSIYSHFEMTDNFSNAAEKTRACLSPLASIAQDLGITIIGTFHENKASEYLGSTEMLNVSRVVLQASRSGEGPLKIKVRKTNFNQPDYSLNMLGDYEKAESLDGDPWMEVNEDGIISQKELYVVKTHVKSTGEEETEHTLPTESAKDLRKVKVLEMLNNGISYREISKELDISLDTISRIKNS